MAMLSRSTAARSSSRTSSARTASSASSRTASHSRSFLIPLLTCSCLLLVVFRAAPQNNMNSWTLMEQNLIAPPPPPPPAGTATASSSSSSSPSQFDFDKWLDNDFRARDASRQEWCQQVWREGTFWKDGNNVGAQFGQDIFMARNVFLHDKILSGQKGFYIEAGANHAEHLSVTLFYDACLGWDGLCIEPQEQYHQEIREKRTCTLLPKCLMNEPQEMMIGGLPAHRGAGMFVKPLPPNGGPIPDSFLRIHCAPMKMMLEEVKSTYPSIVNDDGRYHVDLFVLDVEGAELLVLDTVQWDSIHFTALLLEDNDIDNIRLLDFDMSMRGYLKFHEMANDALYVNRQEFMSGHNSFHASNSGANGMMWYQPNWHSFARNEVSKAKKRLNA